VGTVILFLSADYILTGIRHKYYIPFTKKAVDDILEKTNTDKDTVKYYGRFGLVPNSGFAFRNGEYTYDQFVNTTWEEFEALARRDGGPTGKVQWVVEEGKRKFVG
jgi:hypothetical protein